MSGAEASRRDSGAGVARTAPAGIASPRPFALRVRDAVLSIPDVAALSGGVLGEVATYLPGDRVPGVRVGDDGVHVHVVVTPRGVSRIPAVAGAVHGTVRHVLAEGGGSDAPAPEVPVHVHVDDVAVADPGDAELPHRGTREDER